MFTKVCLLSRQTSLTVNNSSFLLGKLQETSKPVIPVIAVIFMFRRGSERTTQAHLQLTTKPRGNFSSKINDEGQRI